MGADSHPVSAKKTSEFRWEIFDQNRDFIADYSVNTKYSYSSLNTVRLPYRDAEHLYFPAASVFLQPEEEYLSQNRIGIRRIRVSFDLPEGWTTATSWGADQEVYELHPADLENLNTGLIGAGEYRIRTVEVQGIPVTAAFLNSGPLPDERILQLIRQALLAGEDLFGIIPMPRLFVMLHFIFEHPGQGSGNALGWSINLNEGRSSTSPDWPKGKSSLFHEIFHFWNGTEPSALSRADNSLIWFTEGVTRYYQYRNMLSAGVIAEGEFYERLSLEFSTACRNQRLTDTLESISRNYFSDPSAMELAYSKGCCLAFALDIWLRQSSGCRLTFDSVLRKLLEQYGYAKNRHLLTHAELNLTLRELLGTSYPKYERLYGDGFRPEFISILNSGGFEVKPSQGRRLYFGIVDFGPPGGTVRAHKLDRDSLAYRAGLRESDVLLEIDGRRVSSGEDLDSILKGLTKESVDLKIERNGRTLMIRTPWLSHETRFMITAPVTGYFSREEYPHDGDSR